MTVGRHEIHRQSVTVAFCGMIAALGVVLMLTGGLIPVMTYCAPLTAGVLLLPVREEFGRSRAWMVWVITAVLALIMSADREAAFFYVFLGYYPIIKKHLDRLPTGRMAFGAKLLFFALSLGLMYALLLFVFQLDLDMDDLVWVNAVFYLALVVIMMIYDRAVDRLTAVYRTRIRPKLKFLR